MFRYQDTKSNKQNVPCLIIVFLLQLGLNFVYKTEYGFNNLTSVFTERERKERIAWDQEASPQRVGGKRVV